MELGNAFTIVHITDLHFSPGADIEEDHVYSPLQLKGIESVLRKKSIDRLIVTGDITEAGDPNSLLRAKDWLYGDFSVSGKEKIGLKLNKDKVRVIPGNHDAFNLKEDNPLTYKDRWQKSLSNFYDAFQDAKAVDTDGCRYEWIPFGESDLFLTYIDTSFLGDPHDLENEKGFSHYLKRIPRVARGTIY